MTYRQLHRAVAAVTGESLREIRRRGFGLADPPEVDFDPEPDDLALQIVNWDALALERCALFPAKA
jgi:hypothetical protein